MSLVRFVLAVVCSFGLVAGAPGVEAATAQKALVFSGELSMHAFQTAVAQDREIRITYSQGGSGAAAMALAGAKAVVIDGECVSACAWAFVIAEHACFTDKAVFKFHAAHDPGTGRRILTVTDYWLGMVTTSLRGHLDGLRSSSKLITVTADAMKHHYADRACDRTGHRPSIRRPTEIVTAAVVLQPAIHRAEPVIAAHMRAAIASAPRGPSADLVAPVVIAAAMPDQIVATPAVVWAPAGNLVEIAARVADPLTPADTISTPVAGRSPNLMVAAIW
jgi:hypothetical protein